MILFLTMRKKRGLKSYSLMSLDIQYTLVRGGVYLFLILLAHVFAMVYFENLSFGDAAWLTMTTITTVGYGDISATSLGGRVATVTVLFIGGIYIFAETAGRLFDYFNERREKKLRGEWRWNMSGHIVIINTPEINGEQYLVRLIKQFRKSDKFKHFPIQIITSAFGSGLPLALREIVGVVHHHGRGDDVDAMCTAKITEADIIIVLAKNEGDKASDGRTFDILHRLQDLGVKGKILAEGVDDKNRERLLRAGADVIIRPIRAYPEMVVRAFTAPGCETIIENMFVSEGDEYRRYDIEIKNRTWAEVVCAVAKSDMGTAVAYITHDTNKLHCNPRAQTEVYASALFLIVRDDNIPDIDVLRRVVV